MYVAVLHERKQRLEINRNLQSNIPDVTAFEIIESLKPYLQQKKYYHALELLITNIGQHVSAGRSKSTESIQYPGNQQGSWNTPLPINRTASEYEIEKAKFDAWKPVALWTLVSGAIVFVIWAWRYKRKYREMYTVNGVYVGIGSAFYSGDNDGGSYYTDSSSSDSGGWGGDDGGGGFDGGGASGDW